MLEVAAPILAWLSVVLLQALVHFSLGAKKRESLQESDRDQGHNLSPDLVIHTSDDDEEDSLDGDEPDVFFELLSQTGSEMMSVSWADVHRGPKIPWIHVNLFLTLTCSCSHENRSSSLCENKWTTFRRNSTPCIILSGRPVRSARSRERRPYCKLEMTTILPGA